ncbi:MAG: hypothetical protein ABIH00_11440 [Armatimonadota bacterium]
MGNEINPHEARMYRMESRTREPRKTDSDSGSLSFQLNEDTTPSTFANQVKKHFKFKFNPKNDISKTFDTKDKKISYIEHMMSLIKVKSKAEQVNFVKSRKKEQDINNKIIDLEDKIKTLGGPRDLSSTSSISSSGLKDIDINKEIDIAQSRIENLKKDLIAIKEEQRGSQAKINIWNAGLKECTDIRGNLATWGTMESQISKND